MNALQVVQQHPYSSSGEWAVPEDDVSDRAQTDGDRERERYVTFRLDQLDAAHKADVRDLMRRVEANHDSQNAARHALGQRLGGQLETHADELKQLAVRTAGLDDLRAEVKQLRGALWRLTLLAAGLAGLAGYALNHLPGL